MKGHLLQSSLWEEYEKLEAKPTTRLTGDNFNCLILENRTALGPYLYLPYGPSTPSPQSEENASQAAKKRSKKTLKSALRALVRLGKSKDAIFIRIEPTTALNASEMAKIAQKLGYTIKKSKNLDPEHTWVLDLAPEKDALLKGMEPRKARYWRNYTKKGMEIRRTQDPEEITILTDLLKTLGEKDNFTPQTEQHLKNQLRSGFATLYIVDLQKTPIAAALVYDFDGVRYYAHAATDFEHRNLMAGTILLIQLILDAKDRGEKYFDFWGITTSEDKNHPWYGFTQYKKSFGGRQVDFAGTYDLVLNPLKYRLYSLLRFINLKLRSRKK